MFQDYVEHLPAYRGCPSGFQGVTLRRAQFGVVPNWHNSPPKPATARLLHVGDSAGNRSALSFAGTYYARSIQRAYPIVTVWLEQPVPQSWLDILSRYLDQRITLGKDHIFVKADTLLVCKIWQSRHTNSS